MVKEFDPDNLTAGDIVRAVAPTILAILAIYLVQKFAPNFLGIAVVILIALVLYVIFTMPKKDVESIGKADRELNDNIGKIPVIGPLAKPLWRVIVWLSAIVSLITIILLVFGAIDKMAW